MTDNGGRHRCQRRAFIAGGASRWSGSCRYLTALIAVWLAWDTFSKRGPTITISFETAAGLTAGQSQLKYRNVVMGTVKTITVAPDLSQGARDGGDGARGRAAADRQDDLLGGQAAALRRQRHRPRHAAVRLLHRHAADRPRRASRSATSSASRIRRSSRRRPRAPPSCWRASGWARSAWARRSSSAISRSAPCSAGTSATWPATSPSTPSCARRTTSTCTRIRPSGTPRACRSSSPPTASTCSRIAPGAAAGRHRLRYAARIRSPRSRGAAIRFPLYASQEVAQVGGLRPSAAARVEFHRSVAGLSVGADVTLYGLKIGEVTEVGLVYDPKQDRIVAPVHYRIEADRITGISAAQGLPRARSPRRWSSAGCAPPCRRRA